MISLTNIIFNYIFEEWTKLIDKQTDNIFYLFYKRVVEKYSIGKKNIRVLNNLVLIPRAIGLPIPKKRCKKSNQVGRRHSSQFH